MSIACPTCHTVYSGAACPICATLQRIRTKAAARRREHAQAKAQKRDAEPAAESEPRLPYAD
jgi:hypothetical protein